MTCAICPVTADDIELNLRPWTNNQEIEVDIRYTLRVKNLAKKYGSESYIKSTTNGSASPHYRNTDRCGTKAVVQYLKSI